MPPPWNLHAKCVVVDDRLTLIGSANFTGRGQITAGTSR